MILLVDAIISIVKIKNIRATLQKIEKINEQIKEKLLELKEINISNENIQILIDKMKSRRDKSLKRLYKRAYRLKKAFPAIDTKEFTEILNKKVEFRKKEKTKKGD